MRALQNERSAPPAETLAETVYLTKDNAVFDTEGDFLALKLTQDTAQQPSHISRVTLRRAFPFDSPWRYILVSDRDDQEIGMIADISAFDERTETLLRRELERFYYTPKIKSITSVKERAGFSYWEVGTDEGPMSFTVQDTFRNILRIGEDRAAVFDVDGNRFEIVSIAALDRKSYKKIELYL